MNTAEKVEKALMESTWWQKALVIGALVGLPLWGMGALPSFGAGGLPDCNDPQVRSTLSRILGRPVTNQASEMRSDWGKRWCSIRANVSQGQRWASTARMYYDHAEWQNVAYSVEWIDKASGRFYVQTQ